MRVVLFLVFLSSFLFIFSCSKELDVSKSFDSSILDLNGDGISDVSYEDAGEGYYELIDRNFDSKVDVSNFYGKKNDEIISSKQDDNFDGYLETKTIFENGLPAVTVVDESCDGLASIVFVYKDGVAEWSEKLVSPVSDSAKGSIRRIEYKFGFPESDVLKEFLGRKEDFNKKVLSYMAGHTYTGCL